MTKFKSWQGELWNHHWSDDLVYLLEVGDLWQFSPTDNKCSSLSFFLYWISSLAALMSLENMFLYFSLWLISAWPRISTWSLTVHKCGDSKAQDVRSRLKDVAVPTLTFNTSCNHRVINFSHSCQNPSRDKSVSCCVKPTPTSLFFINKFTCKQAYFIHSTLITPH